MIVHQVPHLCSREFVCVSKHAISGQRLYMYGYGVLDSVWRHVADWLVSAIHISASSQFHHMPLERLETLLAINQHQAVWWLLNPILNRFHLKYIGSETPLSVLLLTSRCNWTIGNVSAYRYLAQLVSIECRLYTSEERSRTTGETMVVDLIIMTQGSAQLHLCAKKPTFVYDNNW